MTVVRITEEKASNGKYFVEAYHNHAEVLTEDQKKGTIVAKSFPTQPRNPGYISRLTADTEGNLEWLEIKTKTPAQEQLVKLITKGKLTLSDIEDEDERNEIEKLLNNIDSE